ncbi:hypothetical protein ACFQZM_27085 [Actinomadura fibrosa]|uniref:Gluconate 2-dehydrogenase subunit 3 family protein n=2 Tax=Actinomadura fibrosa TaxID=111802 RepID=A0ABW2XP71_9ACTN|nr:hypothetical protein [Actinomadura fibrosa]
MPEVPDQPKPGMPRTRRRAFLGTAGALAAAASLPLAPGEAHASARLAPGARTARQDVRAARRDALAEWTLDTMKGLAVFVVPGPDPYSRAQGTPRPEPGGIEAGLPAFLVDMLDRYLPFPDLPAGGLADALLPLLGPAGAGLFESDAVIPLSPVVALLLNAEAVRADPRSLTGPFLTPFARLPYRGKAKVFEMIEGPDPALVEVVDAQLPEPLKRTASGLLRYLGGALLELSALGGYSEWAVFDPGTRRLRARPVGWQVTGYQYAEAGRPEFRGYYQGRRSTTG